VREKKGSEGDKNTKVDGEEEREKKRQIRQKEGLQKNEKRFARWSSGGSTPDSNQEGSEARLLNQ
jgi:hypothetical protein